MNEDMTFQLKKLKPKVDLADTGWQYVSDIQHGYLLSAWAEVVDGKIEFDNVTLKEEK